MRGRDETMTSKETPGSSLIARSRELVEIRTLANNYLNSANGSNE